MWSVAHSRHIVNHPAGLLNADRVPIGGIAGEFGKLGRRAQVHGSVWAWHTARGSANEHTVRQGCSAEHGNVLNG
jgi:hypothetical protein